VRSLVDSSGWSRYLAQLGGGSRKAATIAKLNAYADAHVAKSDRKPIDQVVGRMTARIGETARMKAGTSAWLKAHRA
jgi:puromycin-sensitive aminopeptidase